MPGPTLPALTGIITPMFTPITETGALSPAGVKGLIEYFRGRRVINTAFVRCGMGNMYSFTVDETKAIADAAVDAAAGEIGIIVGCAGEYRRRSGERPDPQRYLEQSIELSQYVADRGAQAAVLVVPMALAPEPGRPLADTIYDYYAAVDAAVDFPLAIYHPPGLDPAYRLTPETMERLLSLRHIRGMKLTVDTHEEWDPIAAVTATRPDFALICGNEYFHLEALKTGAVGCIGGGGNTHPELMFAVQDNFLAGRLAEAEKAQAAVNETRAIFKGLGHGVAGIQYMVRQGAALEPRVRGGRGPYPGQTDRSALYPPEVMDPLAAKLDALLRPYRQAYGII
jgi:4-hydroxy-tetrahydrodipicolinate synthase